MPRTRNPIPNYKKHPTKNEARCWIDGKWISLGTWDSPESKQAYQRICKQLVEAAPVADAVDAKKSLYVYGLLAKFLKFAKDHFRDAQGQPTPGADSFRQAIRAIEESGNADILAREFGPKVLQKVRTWMIRQGWCRMSINRHINRIKRIFKWAVSEELIPVAVYQSLTTVSGLQKGRSGIKEMPKVLPVPMDDIQATKPFLNRHTRAMVDLQLLTGMRPGEVCQLRLADLDRSQKVWVWRPEKHKTAHLERAKTILFGPRAQAVITEFLAGCVDKQPTDTLFSPREAREERYRGLRSIRKSKVPPSQLNRKKVNAKKPARDCYHVTSYANHVARAAKLAGVMPWSPGQLRHNAATEIRKKFGLEAAQVMLGHASADVTQIYAERNLELGVKIAATVG